MVRAFLTQRTMSVKINNTKSAPLPVQGGSPQGSILANYLFCLTTELFSEQDLHSVPRDCELPVPPLSPRPGGYSPPQEMRLASPELEPGTDSDEDEIRARDFLFFRPLRRLEDSVLSVRSSQAEIDDYFGIPSNWTDHPLTIQVYIDDTNCIEKVKHLNSVSVITEGRRTLKIHAPKTEKFFESSSSKAKEIKMVVNQKKTQMLCISASTHDDCVTYIRPVSDGQISETSSANQLKILGFWFSSKPTVSLHVTKMCEKFRARLWGFRRLKLAGLPISDLLKIYTTVLRPILEFACVTFGPMLTNELSDTVERLQLKVLKIAYGLHVSYNAALTASGQKTLKTRRNDLLRKFALKTVKNGRYSEKWFPLARSTQHETRFPKRYLEQNSRTERLYKSPLFTMRRLLNE